MTRMFYIASTPSALSGLLGFAPGSEHAQPEMCARFASWSRISVGYLPGNQDLSSKRTNGAAM